MTIRCETGVTLGGTDYTSALARLAAYEDSGLEPEDVVTIVKIAGQASHKETNTQTGIEAMGLTVRTFNALLRHGFRTFEEIADFYHKHNGDLSQYSPRKWYNNIRNMGEASAREVEEKMRELGLI